MVILVGLIWVINFAISWLNAWAVGKSWVESKAQGGWPHFINWMAAIMSASGFTWCYVIILAFGAHALHKLDMRYVTAMIQLGYLVVILPILGSGLAITIDSWAHFYRKRNWLNGGVAGWNTFAQVYNTVNALRGIPDAFGGVVKVLFGKDRKNNATLLVIMLVVLAVIGGVATTMAIIRATAKSHAEAMSGLIDRKRRDERIIGQPNYDRT
jgi:hypothetical protein